VNTLRFDYKTMQATPEWLTSVLRASGHLNRGEVSSVEQETMPSLAHFSAFIALKVKYAFRDHSDGESSRLPANFLMKLVKPEFYTEKEIGVYELFSDPELPLPIVRCYRTERAPEAKQGYMLLEDLTQTHHQPQMPLPPISDHGRHWHVNVASAFPVGPLIGLFLACIGHAELVPCAKCCIIES